VTLGFLAKFLHRDDHQIRESVCLVSVSHAAGAADIGGYHIIIPPCSAFRAAGVLLTRREVSVTSPFKYAPHHVFRMVSSIRQYELGHDGWVLYSH
jgi:hypothetical protein